MTKLYLEKPTKAVVISVDSESYQPTTIELAVAMAALLQRPLHGIFIEDADLASVAGLPFTSEICLSTGQPRLLDEEQLQRRLDPIARQFRQKLAQLSEQSAVQWHYSAIKGKKGDLRLTEYGSAELLVVEKKAVLESRNKRAGQLKRLLLINSDTQDFYSAVKRILHLFQAPSLMITIADKTMGHINEEQLQKVIPEKCTIQKINLTEIPSLLEASHVPVDYIIISRSDINGDMSTILQGAQCPVIIVG